jgi:translation initiation factor IF-1
MPKNTKGGSGHKKQKNKPMGNKIRRAVDIAKKPEEFEVYGRVLRPLGNRRMEVYTQIPNSNEYQTIVCRIRGSLRTHMAVDDFVLVQLFDFNTKQGQIADVYSSADVDTLIHARCWDMTSARPDSTGRPADLNEMSEDDDRSESDSDTSSNDEDTEKAAPAVQDIDVI